MLQFASVHGKARHLFEFSCCGRNALWWQLQNRTEQTFYIQLERFSSKQRINYVLQGYIVGFTELGNCDDFSTEMLEWRLGCSEIINYKGDLAAPPDNAKAASSSTSFMQNKQKTIRGQGDDSDSDFE